MRTIKMQPEIPQAVPFKTDQATPVTKYEVEDNGDVMITQTVTTKSWWKAREFMTLIRQNKEALEKTKYNTSAEFVAKMKEQENKLIAEMDSMSPVMEKAEELTKNEYERQRHEGLKKNLIDSLEAKETPYEWFKNIWTRAKKEVTAPIFQELDSETQSKLLKVLARLKRKGA